MKIEVKILELTYEELTDIIITAFYGNDAMAIDYEATPSIIHECLEENAAQVLLDGGHILVTDWLSDCGDSYGNLPREIINGFVTYKVTLQDILKGSSNPECFQMLYEIRTGEGDIYTAWNLFQMIIFGEIIYG